MDLLGDQRRPGGLKRLKALYNPADRLIADDLKMTDL